MIEGLRFDHTSRIMALAPHPDDESLATGGLLQHAFQARARVRVEYATNGENNPWPQRVLERRWRIQAADRQRWGGRRKLEAIAALKRLGAPRGTARFWELPDQGLTRLLMQDPEGMTRDLARRIAAFKPTHLLAPALQDVHPDHSALGVLALLARDQLAASGLNFTLLRYVVHGRLAAPANCLTRFDLSNDAVTGKREAIGRHYTQLALSRGRFLSYAQPQELFLTHEPDGSVLADHFVRRISVSDACIALDIMSERPLNTPNPARLLVLGDSAGRLFSLSGTIHRSTPNAPFLEIQHARPVSAMAFWTNRHAVRLRLAHPDSVLPNCLFVKWETKAVFFDRMGWRAYDLGARHPAAFAAGARSVKELHSAPVSAP